MLHQLDPAARALADYMSGLSEEAYCAAWMQDLEFELWRALGGGPTTYGRLELTHAHVARLENSPRLPMAGSSLTMPRGRP